MKKIFKALIGILVMFIVLSLAQDPSGRAVIIIIGFCFLMAFTFLVYTAYYGQKVK